jgi:ATP-dependent Clp protease protease subunit
MANPPAPRPRKSSKAEDEKFRAEGRKADAEARKALAEAEAAEIDLERKRHEERKRLALDEHHHVYRFIGEVSGASVKTCIDQLQTWHRLDPACPLTLILQSPGGEIISGMALWDYLQELRDGGHHLTTIARGYAASMAGILLQAGDVRVIGSEAWLLVHEASFGAGGSMGQVEDTVEWVKAIQKRILEIFAARSRLSVKQIERRWKRKNWWLDSTEALKLGFVDRIG